MANDKCEKCYGTGKVGVPVVKCENYPIGCDCTEGRRRIGCKAKLGWVTVSKECPECGGTGVSIPHDQCGYCGADNGPVDPQTARGAYRGVGFNCLNCGGN